MDFLGVGPLEVIFIFVIALIIFGPKDIVKAGQETGKFLRRIIKSPGWQTVQKTSRDLRTLPNKLIREAGLEEVQTELNDIGSIAKTPDLKKEIQKEFDKVGEGLSAWTTPAPPSSETVEEEDNPPSGTTSGGS
jgi:Sec-independent protein translocase protein TatA